MEQEAKSNIVEPVRPVASKYVTPILYLAAEMSSSDKFVAGRELTVINQLAEAANLKDFRLKREYREYTRESACADLDLDVAKRAALVIISLVLKADEKRDPMEHEYFKKIRTMLQSPPITVPVGFEAHKALALKYLVKS